MAQAPRPLTPHVSLRHYLGGELRYWREQAGLSQDGLGRLVHFSGDTISRVEKAERTPNPALIEACDRELGAGGALIRLLALAERRDAMPGQPRAPAPPTTASTVMNAEWKWIGPTLPVEHAGGHQSEALSRALTRREIAETTVQSLQDLVHTLRRLDDEVGPKQLVGAVTNHLRWVTDRLAEAERRGTTFTALCGVAAELSQLAGWLSFDMSLTDEARRHLKAAHQAAMIAGDVTLAAYALGWTSIVAGQHDASAGLALARAAQHRSGIDAAPSVTAWLTRVEAEALAATGDRAGSEEALERVQVAAARPRSERDPSWTYFISDGQIAAYRGVCYVRLGQGRHAEVALREALAVLQPSFTRDRCLYMTYLAAAHLQQGQPDLAASVALSALGLAVETGSPRSIQRLQDVRRGLDRWDHLPGVMELHELLLT